MASVELVILDRVQKSQTLSRCKIHQSTLPWYLQVACNKLSLVHGVICTDSMKPSIVNESTRPLRIQFNSISTPIIRPLHDQILQYLSFWSLLMHTNSSSSHKMCTHSVKHCCNICSYNPSRSFLQTLGHLEHEV